MNDLADLKKCLESVKTKFPAVRECLDEWDLVRMVTGLPTGRGSPIADVASTYKFREMTTARAGVETLAFAETVYALEQRVPTDRVHIVALRHVAKVFVVFLADLCDVIGCLRVSSRGPSFGDDWSSRVP